MNLALRCLYIALAVVLPEAGAWATVYEVVARPNLEFAQHDGTRLAGDLYLPKGLEKPPVIVAIPRRGVAGRQPHVLQVLGAISGS